MTIKRTILGGGAAAFLMLASQQAQALEIWQYDRLADGDQARFVTLLAQGAMDLLRKAGHADQAAMVGQLFNTKNPNDKRSPAFLASLAQTRAADDKRAIEMPDATRLEVEDAILAMLKPRGIMLPDSFFMVNKDFRARLPVKRL
jgi:hypothetical protein